MIAGPEGDPSSDMQRYEGVGGILPGTTVWTPGTGPAGAEKMAGPRAAAKAPSSRINRSQSKRSVGLPKQAWRTIEWREGTAEPLSSRFARVRARVAHRDYALSESRPEEWLLIEWPEGEEKPAKFWLSTLPKNIAFRKMVDLTKLRWRIERNYQELKQKVGLGHFEGRGWRGFHHHATLCIAAYGFLISERETIPPSGAGSAPRLEEPAVPGSHRPEGSPTKNRTSRPQLNRDDAQKIDRCTRHHFVTMSMLRRSDRKTLAAQAFMTQ